jgi:hypothetical protein
MHRHFCDTGCGAYYYCSRPDGCDRDDWTCPQCNDDELADAKTAQETINHRTEQELSRAEN